ncbi:hypothetical protein I317_01316 [Kwoniella heveanensis CBS 569]|uniref:Uncharacterized protein n=1 Tax=Kwoniella heveanensis BCC8398 TaxID=1296120 RepID=A0A1B9GRY0_9TREE|nr:hypothetical protein I316_04536 [Kwoniella heveanensis BCC8398]OCF44827.1 hypothetical protein I317_01316 [Kwoniella heveanensis CBS 569]
MTSTPNSVSAPTGPSEVVAIHCKWDFCAETFVSFAEWETHFAVEHVAHARPVNLTGRKQRLREDGYWELVDEEAGPREHLPLHQIPSQTTGDITTTTHTLSYPLPPSFQPIDSSMISSYPADASHLPLHPLTPDPALHQVQARTAISLRRPVNDARVLLGLSLNLNHHLNFSQRRHANLIVHQAILTDPRDRQQGSKTPVLS